LRFRPVGIWANILDARVALKEDHKLIRTGPYAHFRHPVYSGIDLAAVAGALAIDQRQCVLGVSLIVLGYWIKAKKEESMLTAQFREAKEHCQHSVFLIPKF
jgi:protein-S-isoprenylcysteine O-methyltransferase Ste14